MPFRNQQNPAIPENATVNRTGLVITSNLVLVAPQITPTVLSPTTTAYTVTGATIDLGYAGQRIGVLAQYVTNSGILVPAGITIETQWSDDNVNWYVAPTSAQGDARSSTITSAANDRTLITRGQVLTRYLRFQMVKAASVAGQLGAGNIYLWYTRI